jgi:hypothetical protein
VYICHQCERFIFELIAFKSSFHAPHCGLLYEAMMNVVTALCGSEAVSESKAPHKIFRVKRRNFIKTVLLRYHKLLRCFEKEFLYQNHIENLR